MGLFTDKDDAGLSEFADVFKVMERNRHSAFKEGYKTGLKEARDLSSRATVVIMQKMIIERLNRARDQLQLDILAKPSEFGQAVGYIIGTINHNMSVVTQSKDCTAQFSSVLAVLKKIEGFDMRVITKRLKRVDYKEIAPLDFGRVKELLKAA